MGVGPRSARGAIGLSWVGFGAVVSLTAAAAPGQGLPNARVPSLLDAFWWRGEAPAFDGPTGAQAMLLVPRVVDDAELWNDVDYLEDLQRRYGARGVPVVLVLDAPPESSQAVPGSYPVAVAASVQEWLRGLEVGAALVDAEGDVRWIGGLDVGMGVAIQTLLAGGDLDPELARDSARRMERMREIESYPTEELARLSAALLERNSGNPDGWALQLLVAYERQQDPAAARRVAAAACKNLALESKPLARFVALMLRTVGEDRPFLQEALMALVPVAAGARHDLPLQLTFLRVLNGLGREQEARALVERLEEVVAQRPTARAAFAEALAAGPLGPQFVAIALPAIDAALAETPDERELQMIRFNVLDRGGDAAARDAQLARLTNTNAVTLNNEAWYLMTRAEVRGRFNRLALAMCEAMQRDRTLDYAERDTMALALFLNGRIVDALEMQRPAAKSAENERYDRRLRRYERAVAQQQGEVAEEGAGSEDRR
ncbi:MAG: hypothetical protein AAF628_19155 [Planctomycetota bacterium]